MVSLLPCGFRGKLPQFRLLRRKDSVCVACQWSKTALIISALVRWTLAILIAVLVLLVPVVYYRADYTHAKRLREVEPGKLYRSGQLTIEGFADAIARYHIRTVINLQDEAPDPDVRANYFDARSMKESDVCRQRGVRYVYLPPELISRHLVPAQRPRTIDRFLEIMDDPANHPVLIHCRAGLHRTGVLTTVYRMEYNGWSPRQAIEELKANGFGRFPCSSANDYIVQYVLTFTPGLRGNDQAKRENPKPEPRHSKHAPMLDEEIFKRSSEED